MSTDSPRTPLVPRVWLLCLLTACNQILDNEPQRVSLPAPVGEQDSGLDAAAGGRDAGPDAAPMCGAAAASSCEPGEDAGPASPLDPCANEPCVRGSCSDLGGGDFSCACASGYDGPTCAHAIEGCSADPCLRGSCKNLDSGNYTCVCPKGYQGQACEHDIDDCAPRPCQHGKCNDLPAGAGYECSCRSGYTGDQCQIDIDECAATPCLRGSCSNLPDGAGYACTCPSGYDGEQCQIDIDECAAKPCLRGTCANLPDGGGYQCSCPAGYNGKNCENDIDECAPKPCAHGTCMNLVGKYQCTCPAGWSGATCAAGSCSGIACASSAPCSVIGVNPGVCVPSACGNQAGLCLAYNSDGGGVASSELLTQTNTTFKFGTNNDWNNKAHYYVYAHAIGNFPYVCIFPQLNLGGNPVVLKVGQSWRGANVFGQSNAFSNAKECSAHAPP